MTLVASPSITLTIDSTPAFLKLALAHFTLSGFDSIVTMDGSFPLVALESSASANHREEYPDDVPISSTLVAWIARSRRERKTPVSCVIAVISRPGGCADVPFLCLSDSRPRFERTRRIFLFMSRSLPIHSLFNFVCDNKLILSASSLACETDCCCLWSWALRNFTTFMMASMEELLSSPSVV